MYASFLKPIVSKHEPEIDRHLNEFWTRAGDMALHYWQRGSVYAQSRFLEVLQYLASQSPPSAPNPQPPVRRILFAITRLYVLVLSESSVSNHSLNEAVDMFATFK